MRRALIALVMLLGFVGGAKAQLPAPTIQVPNGWTVGPLYTYFEGYSYIYYAWIDDGAGNSWLAFFETGGKYPSNPYTMGIPNENYSLTNHPVANFSYHVVSGYPYFGDSTDELYGPGDPILGPGGLPQPPNPIPHPPIPMPWPGKTPGLTQTDGSVTFYYKYAQDSAGNYVMCLYDSAFTTIYAICAVKYVD